MKTAGRAADDHLEMGCAATGPATVGEQVVSDAGERGEDAGSLAFGACLGLPDPLDRLLDEA